MLKNNCVPTYDYCSLTCMYYCVRFEFNYILEIEMCANSIAIYYDDDDLKKNQCGKFKRALKGERHKQQLLQNGKKKPMIQPNTKHKI